MEALKIGEKLKAARKDRDLTLDEVAKLTGVSKPMLGQIERGQSSPTVNTLWKIASGLKVPFSAFLQNRETDYAIVDFKEQKMISEEDGKMRAYTLFAFDPVRSAETFYIEFDAGCEHYSSKHNDGVEEHVFVIQGQLDMLLDGKKVSLAEKQVIRFEANVPHAYLNPYGEICCIYNTIFYHV